MLVEFTVENYRSLKAPVTLSAVAQKSRKSQAGKKRENVKSDEAICPGFEVEGWELKLLPVMAIFGANASGKSNVLQAFSDFTLFIMHELIEREAQIAVHHLTQYDPFKLDSAYLEKSSAFTLKIAAQSVIYEYHLALNQQRILSESLAYSVNTSKRSRLIFSRQWATDAYEWKIGTTISKSQLELGHQINHDEIFLDILGRFNIDLLEPFYQWLKQIFFLNPVMLEKSNAAAARLLRSASGTFRELENDVVNLLRRFDVGLRGIEISRNESNSEIRIYAIHETSEHKLIRWDFQEESLGTQRLFSLALFIQLTLMNGGLILLDELGTNLHPKITSYIIQLFQNPKTNPKGAQLIFTSHDNTLQRNQLLRRDEIWFTEKQADQSTDLYSLADFKVRNDLAIDKAYLDGRFGAVPFLPDSVEELMGVD